MVYVPESSVLLCSFSDCMSIIHCQYSIHHHLVGVLLYKIFTCFIAISMRKMSDVLITTTLYLLCSLYCTVMCFVNLVVQHRHLNDSGRFV